MRLSLAAALLASLASPVRAEPGLTAAPLLLRPMSARPAGMGQAYAAGEGLDSMEYNPAGLRDLGAGTGLAGYQKGFDDADYGLLSFGKDLGRASLAAGLLYHNAGPIDLNLSDGTHKTVTAAQDTAPFIGAAYRVLPWLSIGAAARFLRQTLAEQYSATSFSADAGVHARGPWGLSAGASLQNVGSDVKFESVGDPLPTTLRAGAAWKLRDLDPSKIDPMSSLEGLDLTLAADYVQIRQETGSPRVGMEVGLKTFGLPPILLRAGYLFNRDQEGATFGFGYDGGAFSFDYAGLTTQDLGFSHLLTVRVRL